MCRKNLFVLLLFSLLVLGLVPMTYAQQKSPTVATIYINEILASNAATNIDGDTTQFSDWFELYNAGPSSVNLNGYYLTDDLAAPQKYEITTDVWLASGDHILFWADDVNWGVHTNFKLNGDGESVALFDPAVQLVDSVTYPAQLPDISYGRQGDGAATWVFFGAPTPEISNSTSGFVDSTQAPAPQFSLAGGFYNGSQSVQLSTPEPLAEIRYTLDGTIPTASSPLYSSALQINATAVLRARVFDAAMLPSVVATQTFFIDYSSPLPVISLVTNPDNLWDNNIGIYVEGSNGIPGNCSNGPVNWNQDWERPSNIALYETDNSVTFQLDAGIEIHGGCTRVNPRKSLAIRARDKYGVDSIDAQLFDDKTANSFRSLVLRNSGHDAGLTVFRDALMQQLLHGQMDIDWQGYQPVVVFINGDYWGIHNLREKLNEDYVESNFGIDADEVDFLADYGSVLAGDEQHFDALYAYISSHSLADQSNYEYVQTQMDVDEFMNYQIAEIYYANTDWPANNIKYWRERTPDGKWRWAIYDLDFGFGITSYTHNSLYYAADPASGGGSNPPYSTLFLRKLLGNQAFADEFMQRFAGHINITFDPQRVNAMIDAMQAVIAPEMQTHIDRWYYPETLTIWDDHIDVMRDFGDERPSFMRTYLNSYFGNPGTVDLTVNIVGEGDVFVSGVQMPGSGYTGPYFKNVPMQLTAVPALGHEFVEWQETAVTTSETSLTINTATTITAVFAPTELPNLVINELHYNPSPTQGVDEDFEFLEIYNAGDMAVALDNFTLSDGVDFTFPDGASIAAGEYIVISINPTTYSGNGYQVFQWAVDDKLSNGGERVAISNDLGQVLDEVEYEDGSPWVATPDGDGPSLSLVSPELDNSLAINWASSDLLGGTPGAANSISCMLPATPPTTLGIADAAPDGVLSWTDDDPDESRGYEIWASETAVYFQPADSGTTSLPNVDSSPYLHTNALADAANHFYRMRSINRCMQPTAPSNLVGIFKFEIEPGQ